MFHGQTPISKPEFTNYDRYYKLEFNSTLTGIVKNFQNAISTCVLFNTLIEVYLKIKGTE